jgi:hypothetical protein
MWMLQHQSRNFIARPRTSWNQVTTLLSKCEFVEGLKQRGMHDRSLKFTVQEAVKACSLFIYSFIPHNEPRWPKHYIIYEILTKKYLSVIFEVKNTVFWDVAQCRSCVNWRFGGTSVHTRSTRRHIPEESILHSHCRENLKSYDLRSDAFRRPHYVLRRIRFIEIIIW